MRKRLPQPRARMGTDAPVRPRVRRGIIPAASTPRPDKAGRAAAAAPANVLFSRNSRRETFSRFAMSLSFRPLRGLHARSGEVLGHHPRVVREGDLWFLDLRVPLLLPLQA